MKRPYFNAVLLSVSLAACIVSGCNKEESEEPVIIYYSEGQQEDTAITFTAQDQGTAEPVSGETEVLAPILADRTQPSESAVQAQESETSETSETTLSSEAAETEETTASTTETAASQDGNTAETTAAIITTSAYIYDNAGVIADESAVNSAMASFASDTGVSPAIFTISNSLSGDDFRQYARDTYAANFSDQDHVLIMYQLTPAGTWSWTCVFGSNTGTVFTQDHINQFQSDLTNAFSSGNVDNALVNTFNNAESYD